MKANIYKIILFFILVLLTGCARTVTEKADAGSDIQFDITFGSTFTPDSNHMYYIFFPKSTNPNDVNKLIPDDGQLSVSQNTYTGKYFFDMPEDVFDFSGFDNEDFRADILNTDPDLWTGTQNVLGDDPVTYYYEKFHTNLYSYLRLDANSVRWINGPFKPTANSLDDFAPDGYARSYTLKSGSHIKFSWPLSRMGYTLVKDQYVPYFIVSVVVTQNIPYICDWIGSIEGISNTSGRLSDLYYDDNGITNHPTINYMEESDILTWQVSIQ